MPKKVKKKSTGQFKSDIKKLKAAGVTKVDLRKVKPTSYWRKRLVQFRGVINGKEIAAPLKNKAAIKVASKQGKVVGKFQILPKVAGAKVVKSKTAFLGYKIKYATGVSSVSLPNRWKKETLRDYLERIKATEKVGKQGTQFGFTVAGNRSEFLYSDIEDAIADIETAYGDRDVPLENFSLFNLEDSEDWYL